jgi:hypothetical protein
MRLENQVRFRKIQRISSVLRAFCMVFLALIAIGFVVVTVALVVGRGASIGFYNVWFNLADLTARGRFIVGVLAALTFGVMFRCIYHLHRLMGNYSHGEIFTKDSAGQIRQFGIGCALWGGVELLWAFIPRAVLAHPPNPIQAHGGDLVVSGLIVVTISWFMEMAAEMQEENELTV